MIITYSTVLMIIVIAQIVIACVVLVHVGGIQEATRIVIDRLWTRRGEVGIVEFWDRIQSRLRCCGLNSSSDWKSPSLPGSCCESDTSVCAPFINAFSEGCRGALNDFIHTFINVIGAIALGIIAGIELIGFIFACYLAGSIRNQSKGCLF